MNTFSWVGWVVCWCGFLVLVFVHSVVALYFVVVTGLGLRLDILVTGLFLVGLASLLICGCVWVWGFSLLLGLDLLVMVVGICFLAGALGCVLCWLLLGGYL